MLRGLYTAASGMLATTIANDTLANNLANISTVGFKSKTVNFQSFPEMMITRMSAQGNNVVGGVMTGSQVFSSVTNYKHGPMSATGNTFDLAIEGDGFFTIKDPSGEMYYTRAGNFTVNEEGYVTTTDGGYVQGKLGDINLKLDQGPFRISRAGEITARGKLIDQITITRFSDNNMLEKVGDNYYRAGRAAQKVPIGPDGQPLGTSVHQYALEQSNVNPVLELVNSIQGMRLYEALQKNIHLHNEALGKAVNDVGRYR